MQRGSALLVRRGDVATSWSTSTTPSRTRGDSLQRSRSRSRSAALQCLQVPMDSDGDVTGDDVTGRDVIDDELSDWYRSVSHWTPHATPIKVATLRPTTCVATPIHRNGEHPWHHLRHLWRIPRSEA